MAAQYVTYSPNGNETYRALVTSGDPTNTGSTLTIQYTDVHGNLQTVKNLKHQTIAPTATYGAAYWL